MEVQPPGVTRWQFSVKVEKFNARLAKGCVLSNHDGSWPLASGVASLGSKELGVPKQSSMYQRSTVVGEEFARHHDI